MFIIVKGSSVLGKHANNMVSSMLISSMAKYQTWLKRLSHSNGMYVAKDWILRRFGWKGLFYQLSCQGQSTIMSGCASYCTTLPRLRDTCFTSSTQTPIWMKHIQNTRPAPNRSLFQSWHSMKHSFRNIKKLHFNEIPAKL